MQDKQKLLNLREDNANLLFIILYSITCNKYSKTKWAISLSKRRKTKKNAEIIREMWYNRFSR